MDYPHLTHFGVSEQAERVATRFLDGPHHRGLQAKVNPERVKLLGQIYHDALEELRKQITYNKARGLEATAKLWLVWTDVYRAGRQWADVVVDQLTIPPRMAKKVEMAVRIFSKSYTARRHPVIMKWYATNEARLDLLDVARTWPERTEGSGILKQGPFMVHDTVQSTPKNLQKAKGIIDKAHRAMKSSRIPGLSSMVYGDIFLVGQIGRKSWAAWYMPSKDAIYLRPAIRGVSPEQSVRHLIHEFGHRLWAKKISSETKRAWSSHHVQTGTGIKVQKPEVGDTLPFKVNNKWTKIVAWAPLGASIADVETDKVLGVLAYKNLMDGLGKTATREGYPTAYASTEAQEHFCESLSMYALGTLKGAHKDAFEEIIMGITPKSVARIAARYQKKKEVPKANGTGTTTVYEYSERQVADRNRAKAERVEKLRNSLHKLQAQVKKDLKSKDMHTRLCALAVGLMNDTYERVGNETSAKDGHVGVTGWAPKHLSFSGSQATISYVGKSGVSHKKVTKDADLVRVMKELVKGKDKGESLFTHADGVVNASSVNDYLSDLGLEITAKDIRGLHANREMQDRLKSVRSKGGALPKDKKERTKKLQAEFNKALKGAADAVGHESSTLRSQYLVPGLEDAFLMDGSVLTKFHEKKGAQDRLAALYLLIKKGTKTPAQKEDKDVRQMLKSEPKKKPPREDLRRNRMRTDDPDLPSEKSTDMSLNYKKVGSRWLRAMIRKAADTHKPGDVWRGSKGKWVAKNKAGVSHSFEEKSKAEAYARGTQEDTSQDPVKALRSLADALASSSTKKIEQAKKALLDQHPDLESKVNPLLDKYNEVSKSLAKAAIKANGLKGTDLQKALKALDKMEAQRVQIVEAVQDLGSSKDKDTDRGNLEEPEEDSEDPEDPEEPPEEDSEDPEDTPKKSPPSPKTEPPPWKIDGVGLSDKALDSETLTDRAEATFKRYLKGKPSVRQEAADKVAQKLASLDPDSPEHQELNRILDGLHAAFESNGESISVVDKEGQLLREPLDSKMKLLFRQMSAQGDVRALLAGPSQHRATREAIRDALGQLSDGELQEMAKDTPWEPLADVLGGMEGLTLDPAVSELLRSLVRDLSINSMTLNQGLISAVANKKQTSAKMPSSNPLEVFEEARQKFSQGDGIKSQVRSFVECLQEAKTPQAQASCMDRGDTLRMAQLDDMESKLLEVSQKMGVEVDPQNPAVAALRHARDTGDFSVLDEDLQVEKTLSQQQNEWIESLEDPEERERVQKMSPEEFLAMRQSILGDSGGAQA